MGSPTNDKRIDSSTLQVELSITPRLGDDDKDAAEVHAVKELEQDSDCRTLPLQTTQGSPWWSESMAQRKQREMRYTMQLAEPIGTHAARVLVSVICKCATASLGLPCVHLEEHMKEQDDELCEYVSDCHCTAWIIGPEKAIAAYRGMLDRGEIWSSGRSIFDSKGLPLWSPVVTTATANQRTLHASPTTSTSDESSSPHGYTYQSHAYQDYTFPGYPIQCYPAQDYPVDYRVQNYTYHPTAPSLPASRTEAGMLAQGSFGILTSSPYRKRKLVAKIAKAPEVAKITADEKPVQDILKPPYAAPAYAELTDIGPRRSCIESVIQQWPWRKGFAAEEATKWDDSIYPAGRLAVMDTIRARNKIKINAYENATDRTTKRASGPKPKTGIARICFLNDEQERKAKALYCNDVADAMSMAITHPEDSRFSNIEVYYNPCKENVADLEYQSFSIMDSARTRLQLKETRVLSDKGAQRVIDFCPDEIWQKTLLKIVGETTYSNVKVWERLMENGEFLAVTSITHRITKALGKPQAKHTQGEKDRFNANHEHLKAYKQWHANQRPLIWSDLPE